VELSVRYLPDRQLPDKALDVLDEACALTQVVVSGLASPAYGNRVTADVVAQIIATKTGIPVVRLSAHERQRLQDIEASLRQRVIGQDEAVARVAGVLRRASVGLKDPRRPLGVFLCLGPTGVGKTLLAKALADLLFHGEDQIIRLDMSEYKEPHAVAKLIGAPPGYVGYEDEGQLTGKLRTGPYAVVLLDEIEKAHPEVLDLFLQVFDEGRLTDAKGRTIVASHALFIMTSNLPPKPRLGFQPQATPAQLAQTLNEIHQFFRPEFLNRLDAQVVFRHLTEAHIATITRQRLAELEKRLLARHGLVLEVTDAALAFLARAGYDVCNGARELNRCVETMLEEPLSEQIIAGTLCPGMRVIAQITPDGQALRLVPDTGTIP
jgi:ATP-dependent Clp protease ATP-binding subunit ClpC